VERFRLILRESFKVVVEARRDAEKYRASGNGKTLAVILHRPSPTAQMLGLSDLSAEATAIEDCLSRNAGSAGTRCLSGLLTQALGRIVTWMEGVSAKIPAE
jgi:hypothetical protein